MTPCKEWQGSRDMAGYGRLGNRLVHRMVWLYDNGPIPDGMMIRHKCDNPSCFNIDHLEIGTHEDNMRDMAERGRRKGKGGVPGNQHAVRRPGVAEAIKVAVGSYKEIAARFGVSPSYVSLLKRGLRGIGVLSRQ